MRINKNSDELIFFGNIGEDLKISDGDVMKE
jgi:hypothetical protein